MVIIQVIQYAAEESTAFNAGSRFGQRVSQIVMSTDMRNESLSHSNGFSYCVVANGIAFLLQGRFRSGGIGHLGFVVPIDVGGPAYRHTHHP